jgi:hypothetical protein
MAEYPSGIAVVSIVIVRSEHNGTSMVNLVYQQKSKSLSLVSAVVVQSEHSDISIMNYLRFV